MRIARFAAAVVTVWTFFAALPSQFGVASSGDVSQCLNPMAPIAAHPGSCSAHAPGAPSEAAPLNPEE